MDESSAEEGNFRKKESKESKFWALTNFSACTTAELKLYCLSNKRKQNSQEN